MSNKKRNKKLINEMAVGMGSVATGTGEFAESDDDMGPPTDLSADNMSGEEETVTLTKSEFNAAVQDAIDMAWDKCCGKGDDLDDDYLDDDLDNDDDDDDDLDDDVGAEDLDDKIGGVDENFDDFSECMEGIKRIANMLTDDPDILK